MRKSTRVRERERVIRFASPNCTPDEETVSKPGLELDHRYSALTLNQLNHLGRYAASLFLLSYRILAAKASYIKNQNFRVMAAILHGFYSPTKT